MPHRLYKERKGLLVHYSGSEKTQIGQLVDAVFSGPLFSRL